MYHKSEIEQARLAIKKSVRSAIRLKHALVADDEIAAAGGREIDKTLRSTIRLNASLAADREINEVAPRLITEFDQRMMLGELTALADDSLDLVPFRKLRILDFDVECRPMAFYGGDWVTKEITAIAWRFTHHAESSTKVWLLKPSNTWKAHQSKRREGLERFLEAYIDADMVTGHYIRGFDLPLINAACIELGLPPLPAKLAHDTKGDLIRMGGVSKSQENLAAHFETAHPKVGMNTALWEVANSLVREGRQATKARVVGDVNQHIEFRNALLSRRALIPPKQWTSGAQPEGYHA